MYALYLDGVQFPVVPSDVKLKIKNQNKTITLINDGEVSQLKSPGLTDISFKLLLPQLQRYPFAAYPNGFRRAEYYLGILERLKTGKEPFQFILSRTYGRTSLYDTNMTVSLEDYEIQESASYGSDVMVEVKLKQAKIPTTKTLDIKVEPEGTKTATVEEVRSTVGKKVAESHTIKSGETLIYIAKAELQDSGRWKELYQLNKEVIESAAKAHGQSGSRNGSLIYSGTVLQLP